ncbi:MAG: hypothetical protein E7161_03315 [Firmicutes bacterium]|nr:hypothetical protein [Bacillota bacterium]
MKKYIKFIVLFLCLFIFTSKVSAKSKEITDATFNNTNIPYSMNLNANATNRPLFYVTLDSTDAINYNYGYYKICGTGEISVTQDGDCTDGCLDSQINKVYAKNETCTVNNQEGKVTYIFFTIKQWEVGSGTTSIWQLKDYMIFKNISTNSSNYKITNVVLSDTDLYPTFEQANAQNETNDKLGSLEESIQDGFNSCSESYNIFDPSGTLYNGKGIGSDGSIITDSTGSYYDLYIKVEPNTTYTLSNKNDEELKGAWFIVYYGSSKNYLSMSKYDTPGTSLTFSTSSNAQYVRLYSYLNLANVNSLENIMIAKGSTKKAFQPYGEVCQNKLDTQIDQNQTIIDQNEETNNLIGGESDDITSKSCGMICKLKAVINFINPLSKDFFAYKLVELMLNMLKSLFIPEDMDFVTNFVEALESKLGFIAAIPVKIIEFTMSLATATWSEFKSIQLPSISIFGYNFWNAQEIDLTEAINIFKPFKYVTDCICVVICAQTLNKWREKFTGGGSGK